MFRSEMKKYVNGIERYKDNIYDLIFRHYRGGYVHYLRAVPYDLLLTSIISYINASHKNVCGVYQSTLYKSEILILVSG